MQATPVKYYEIYFMWQSPIGEQAVPHWATMLRWIWSISECNLKIRDSQKQTPRRVTCYSVNVEGADLKNNSHSTTHIDPKVVTGGSHVCWLCFNWLKPRHTLTTPAIGSFCPRDLVTSGRAEKSGTCLQCVWQRSTRSIETQMVFQCNPMDFISWYYPWQAYTVKHVSNPRLTATF